jgi:hypothetical protein
MAAITATAKAMAMAEVVQATTVMVTLMAMAKGGPS